MTARWLSLLVASLVLAGCGADAGGSASGVPSVPPLPSPPEGVAMELVEVDPVAFLLPDGMRKVSKVVGREGIRGYYESTAMEESVPGGILVKVEDGSGDLASRVEERTSGFEKLAKIEDLSDQDVPWPGIGPATELRYTAKPYMLMGSAMRTVDRVTVVDDQTVTVSVSAPPGLWDRLGFDTVVESLRSGG